MTRPEQIDEAVRRVLENFEPNNRLVIADAWANGTQPRLGEPHFLKYIRAEFQRMSEEG